MNSGNENLDLTITTFTSVFITAHISHDSLIINILVIITLIVIIILVIITIIVNILVIITLIVNILVIIETVAVLLSRPDKSGHARISGHLGKIGRITPGCL